MQIIARRNAKPVFKLTKRELDHLASAIDTAELIAKNADGEPLGDAALKAVEGLQKVIELVAEAESDIDTSASKG